MGDLEYLDKHFSELSGLIIDNVVSENNRNDVDDDGVLVNILNPKIFKIFNNCSQITIMTTNNNGKEEWRFSLLSFLSFIEISESSIKYVINALRKSEMDDDYNEIYEPTWLDSTLSASISEAFNNKKWNIKQSKGFDE